jgi:hypothetical protein
MADSLAGIRRSPLLFGGSDDDDSDNDDDNDESSVSGGGGFGRGSSESRSKARSSSLDPGDYLASPQVGCWVEQY